MVNFKVSKEEDELINKIVKRALTKLDQYGINFMDLSMDITAIHCNGNPLKLKELLEADDFNFFHDITGIINHINRDTGKLDKHFLPRFSA